MSLAVVVATVEHIVEAATHARIQLRYSTLAVLLSHAGRQRSFHRPMIS